DKSSTKKKALSGSEEVNAFMKALKHPLKEEIEAVRSIILKADKSLNERVKWNAPSFYTVADLVTFNPRAQEHVHLVFHHPAIVKIKSESLLGDYKDRRMMYFRSMGEVNSGKKELTRIMKELVKLSA
ncbi:MAG: hypothetical protein K0S12_2087, partial [Bacteroidetes bacterium]|nr:hypothetical protein [Bacteroidota bacterium]